MQGMNIGTVSENSKDNFWAPFIDLSASHARIKQKSWNSKITDGIFGYMYQISRNPERGSVA